MGLFGVGSVVGGLGAHGPRGAMDHLVLLSSGFDVWEPHLLGGPPYVLGRAMCGGEPKKKMMIRTLGKWASF